MSEQPDKETVFKELEKMVKKFRELTAKDAHTLDQLTVIQKLHVFEQMVKVEQELLQEDGPCDKEELSKLIRLGRAAIAEISLPAVEELADAVITGKTELSGGENLAD